MSLFDCQACGACCCNTKRNLDAGQRSYVEVRRSDALHRNPELLDDLTYVDDIGTRQLVLIGKKQRCIALKGTLGVDVTCEIYELRPAGCRQVEAGDEECLAARRLHPPARRP